MSERLQPGFTVNTINGNNIVVQGFLEAGGQGAIYLINYNGSQKALKWLKSDIKEKERFYEIIRRMVKNGVPSTQFLWPLDITGQMEDGAFGYVMDLCPEGYHEMTEYLVDRTRLESESAIVNAAIEITASFCALHTCGYSWQAIYEGNFFINPKNGKTVISFDTGGILPDEVKTNIIGKCRYMAPEIVLGNDIHSFLSDRFSMAVILYILFCQGHPLEGKRNLNSIILTPETERILYGIDPIFVMNPNNKKNSPHPVIHKKSIRLWTQLPIYIQHMFIDAFSCQALQIPSSRPSESTWLEVLKRFKKDIAMGFYRLV